jgi:hypothetical protein
MMLPPPERSAGSQQRHGNSVCCHRRREKHLGSSLLVRSRGEWRRPDELMRVRHAAESGTALCFFCRKCEHSG